MGDDQVSGHKRPWEPGAPPEKEAPPAEGAAPAEQAGPDCSEDIAPPGEAELAELPAEAPPEAEQPPAAASPAASPAAAERGEGEDGEAPRKRGEQPVVDDRTEEQKLTDKIAWFKGKNAQLVDKLAGLQQQHAELKAALGQRQMQEQRMAQEAQAREQQMRREHQMRQEAQRREQQIMREQQLRREQQMRQEGQMREQQQMMMREQEMRAQQAAAAAAAAALPPHNPDWSEQEHEGAIYYWNSRTGESTYTRPPDFNPPGPGGPGGPQGGPGGFGGPHGGPAGPGGFGQLDAFNGGGMGAGGGPEGCAYGCSGGGMGHAGAAERRGPDRRSGSGTKGPPGANLFYFRKMSKGETDDFTEADMIDEFSKFGEITRAEMSVDRLTGRSKGFGFLSFKTVLAAEAAIAAVHNTVQRGRQVELQRTRED